MIMSVEHDAFGEYIVGYWPSAETHAVVGGSTHAPDAEPREVAT